MDKVSNKNVLIDGNKLQSSRLQRSTQLAGLVLLGGIIVAWMFFLCASFVVAGTACWLQRRTRARKIVSSNPGRSGRRIFFSRVCVLTLIRCPFQPSVTAVARKRPRSFCQKCRWQITPRHAYTFDPTKSGWADYSAVQADCGNLSENELTRNSSGNTRLQASQLAEPLWTDPGLKS